MPVTIEADTGSGSRRSVLHRVSGRGRHAPPTVEQALLRALCHDLGTPLASLRALLDLVAAGTEAGAADEAVELARAQTEHLISLLRTASATGGAAPAGGWPRPLPEVVRSSLGASGLPPAQVRLVLGPGSADVQVADARVQRILVNLLENAHRHGAGRPVLLEVDVVPGRVRLSLTQAGVPDRVARALRTGTPPADLAGLGLWSVQRQTAELGGRVRCTPDAAGVRTTVDLPDR